MYFNVIIVFVSGNLNLCYVSIFPYLGITKSKALVQIGHIPGPWANLSSSNPFLKLVPVGGLIDALSLLR